MADESNDWGASGHQLVSVIPVGGEQLFEEPDVKSEPASPEEDATRTHFDSQDEDNDVFKGYDDLQTIVPTCHQPNSSSTMQKLSKAIILQKSIEYIMFLHQQKKKQEEELEALRKEVMALKIMKTQHKVKSKFQTRPNLVCLISLHIQLAGGILQTSVSAGDCDQCSEESEQPGAASPVIAGYSLLNLTVTFQFLLIWRQSS
ncbi:Max-like protein X [Acropora cervicornis]|uniref:Max-like protein X n=1 Tax=Acropora cervicornis TaxID=6130 RepID=A0AAD9QZ93_ACRCE|nr:Max-like protein X [Acropora cervicornis]